MRMSNTVSVIIPVYNGESVLASAVRDVYAQDHADIELIAVNDGSSDGSLALLRTLASEAPSHVHMKIIDQQNAGICKARNAGLDAASGEFIAFMDQDDHIPSGYISRLVSYMGEDTRAVIGGTIDARPTGDTRRDLDPAAPWSIYRNTAPWGRLFERTLLERHHIRFFDTKISEDFYFNFMYLSCCQRGQVKVIEQSGYAWTIDAKSESHSNMSRIASDRDVTVMLGRLLQDMEPISGESALSQELFEYAVIKHVVWYLLFVSRGAAKDDVKCVYEHTMAWLRESIPNFRKNPELKLGRPKGEAFKIRTIVRTCVALDRIGLLKPLLVLM